MANISTITLPNNIIRNGITTIAKHIRQLFPLVSFMDSPTDIVLSVAAAGKISAARAYINALIINKVIITGAIGKIVDNKTDIKKKSPNIFKISKINLMKNIQCRLFQFIAAPTVMFSEITNLRLNQATAKSV